ncbi:hypothetical protein B5F74_11480 [Collinsella sp. An271]|uniref:S-layer homology domain-containing protein n=1 Tax=Collinsella sp. An271 TaxID=1965616 RepID=UPI000B377E44|nr:S-layer homology domain-containing protein [Collinsella sp. An271]OUO57945.1 hypothetical protein B5F74_11480 [Collinsella sp. An271]
MTACVNRKHTKKVAAVVTASLVGALSLGAAPVAAVADTGIDMQALTPADAFKNGTVAATNGKGEAVTFPAKDDVAFSAGSGEYLLPESITIEGSTIDFNLSSVSGDTKIEWKKSGAPFAELGLGADATKAPSRQTWTAGEYSVTITYLKSGSQYNGASKTINFDIVDTDLTKATVFNATDGNTDASESTFTYNGKAQTVGLAVDGAVLKAADYVVEIKDASNATVYNLTNAGDYTVNVYEPGESSTTSAPIKSIKVTVAKLNLSTADVTISDTTSSAAPTACKADGVDLNTTGGNGDKVDIAVNANISVNGEYTATVKAVSNQANITGSATVTFNKVAEVVADFQYNGNPFPSSIMNVDLSKPVTAYDESLIEVFDTAGTELSSKDYDIWYTDKDGNEASASDLGTLGTWKVNVRVNAKRSDYAIGSDTHTITVKVTGGQVAESDVVFKYKGEVCNDLTSLVYNGEDFLDDIQTVVRSGGKELTAGTDYTVKVVNAAGDEVDKIVDVDTYTISIDSDNYDLSAVADKDITVTVKPVELFDAVGDNLVYAKSDLMQTFGNQTIIPYTGADIDAAFTFGYFTDADGKVVAYDADKNYKWNELPEGTVLIDSIEYAEKVPNGSGSFIPGIFSPVDGLKDTGYYRITVSLGTGVKNYDVNTGFVKALVEVSDAGIFADVPNDAWYSEVVYTAKKNGYINGYAGTQLFGPERDITRAEVVCILYNMAGGKVLVGSDLWNQYLAYATKFDDVDTNMYYAQAIGWAAKFGVVNGYGDGTFAPEKNVTREEFAAMLANYAKAMNDYEAASSDALGSFADAGQVADWAEESVAWAVANKIMGNNGSIDPTSDISRAEVAAMAVNYQPEKITDNFLQ